jgi:hypothetical protein
VPNGCEALTRADPALPTSAAPGSVEKVLVMGARLAAGLPLFIPGDATILARRPTSPGPRGDPAASWERDAARQRVREREKRRRREAGEGG